MAVGGRCVPGADIDATLIDSTMTASNDKYEPGGHVWRDRVSNADLLLS